MGSFWVPKMGSFWIAKMGSLWVPKMGSNLGSTLHIFCSHSGSHEINRYLFFEQIGKSIDSRNLESNWVGIGVKCDFFKFYFVFSTVFQKHVENQF